HPSPLFRHLFSPTITRPPPSSTLFPYTTLFRSLRGLNQEYLEKHFTNPELQGRMNAYELAYRMQAEVPGVLDLAKESEATKQMRSEEHTSELQSRFDLVCRLLLEKKK